MAMNRWVSSAAKTPAPNHNLSIYWDGQMNWTSKEADGFSFRLFT
jgi:hypothetical protein